MAQAPATKEEVYSRALASKRTGFWATVWDWLTTVDHKKIGIMYLVGGLVFLIIGGIEAMLMRLQLAYPFNTVVSAETFNQLMTMHGTTMLFFVGMPLVIGFMNCIMPLQIGARDVAFPGLNAFSLWVFTLSGILLNIAWFVGEAPNAGWFAYAPLTTNEYNPTMGIDFYNLGVQISGIGSLIGAINFITTIITMRAPGMSLLRMPLFTWTTLVTSAIILFAFPPLTINLFLLMFDRLFDTNFFAVNQGGNVYVWQHLFWIFGHPEVYILILPAFGIMSEVFATFSRKRLFGYHSMVFATIVIGFLSFMVWVHHMFTGGFSPIVTSLFAVATMLIAVPTGVKVFNWLFTMWGGRLHFNTAMLFAVGFIPSFVMGGVTGVMLASAPADYQYHDTYFVVGHFHYVILGGTVFGILAGFYYWYPKIFGRFLDERLGKWNFWLLFIGFHITFFPHHLLGLMGMPRRIYTFRPDMGLDFWNLVSTIGAFVMALGFLFFVINLIVTHSRKKEYIPADAWGMGRTLEWTIPSPAPAYNFAQLPLVRGVDALAVEKESGDGKMKPAEPLGPIHMPSSTIVPFVAAFGMFLAGLGCVYRSLILAVDGLILLFASIFIAMITTDKGYHVHPEGESDEKGGSA